MLNHNHLILLAAILSKFANVAAQGIPRNSIEDDILADDLIDILNAENANLTIVKRAFGRIGRVEEETDYNRTKVYTPHAQIRRDQCQWSTLYATPYYPYKTDLVECCNSLLERNMRQSIALGINTPKLGDATKFIQRRAQLEFGLSFEVIVSHENFALSTYYYGPWSCKIMDRNYYYLAYATPLQYNPFNMLSENWLSSIDSQEYFGQVYTLYILLFVAVAVNPQNPMEYEDISIQPDIHSIDHYPNLFKLPDPDEILVDAKTDVKEALSMIVEQKALETKNKLANQAASQGIVVGQGRSEGRHMIVKRRREQQRRRVYSTQWRARFGRADENGVGEEEENGPGIVSSLFFLINEICTVFNIQFLRRVL
ncbi:hypothetical protein WR25_14817 [Diploscapter pachys]|uniref:Ground-like domain-containing protein n=1 Tax=Diploscapter pachys TaxID=2018661 RepID=A0A2A2L7E6_9BILA|nr:hypothetical protein WR25_14817 [Diploscapter pachys]